MQAERAGPLMSASVAHQAAGLTSTCDEQHSLHSQAPCANGMSVNWNIHQRSSSSGNGQKLLDAAHTFTWLTLPEGPSRIWDKCPMMSKQELLIAYVTSLKELSEAEKADRLVSLELNVQKLLSQLVHDDTSRGRPAATADVLDNGSTCREMLTWLSTWEAQDAISANTNPSSCYHREVSHECDPDQDWVQNGSDSDDSTVGDNEQRQAGMLLVGPVGSGKTSLVYTAAQEVGMRVVEINSDCRAKGSCISAVVGEAMQSCSLHLSALAASDAFARPAFAEEKSLILLEELDVQVELDTSLMAPLAKLIGRSKRPVVITCNTTDSLSLSSHITPLQLPLQRPSTKSSLEHLVLVAICEGICTNVASLSQLIEVCHNDVRHALLMAQFWGVGKHLSGNILLRNCSSHGYWRNAMWEVAESISTAIAPPLPEPTEEAAVTGDKQQTEQKLRQSGICSGLLVQEQAAHILSALDVCTSVLDGRHAVYHVPSGNAEAAHATGISGYKDCANAVDAQTAFETAEAREQSSESTAANVAAAVWRDTIVRENTGARVERLAWLRSMAKSTQTSANSGQQRRSSKRQHPLCSRLDLSMQLVEQLACRTYLST
ncbi:hypothetical protein WJX82_001059 [Trebouxia sp. C0006]